MTAFPIETLRFPSCAAFDRSASARRAPYSANSRAKSGRDNSGKAASPSADGRYAWPLFFALLTVQWLGDHMKTSI